MQDKQEEQQAPVSDELTLLCGQRAYLTLMNEGMRKAKMHFTEEDMKMFRGCRSNFDKRLRGDVVLLVHTTKVSQTVIKRWEGVR